MVYFFSSLNFRHSSLITHHSSLKIPYLFGTITHLSSLNIFHIIYGPQTCHSVQLFFFSVPRNLNPVKVKREKKKETQITEPVKKKEKEKEEEGRTLNTQDQTRRRKGIKRKKVDWSKGAAKLWLVDPLRVFNYKNVIELWVMETEKT